MLHVWPLQGLLPAREPEMRTADVLFGTTRRAGAEYILCLAFVPGQNIDIGERAFRYEKRGCQTWSVEMLLALG